MKKEDLLELKKKIAELSDKEKKLRDIELRKMALGEIQGPVTGYASIDKPWLKEFPEEALQESYPHQTMYQMFEESVKGHEDEILLVFDVGISKENIEFTGKEILENIDKLAKNFLERGINPGENVAISFANMPEAIFCLYALNKIGAVVCPIDPRLNTKSLERDLKDLGVKTYIGINDTIKNISKIQKRLQLENIYFVPVVNSLKSKKIKIAYSLSRAFQGNYTINYNKSWNALCKKNVKKVDTYPYKKDKIAIISFTGGTTGIHKGVKITDDGINSMVFSHKYLVDNIKRGDTFMNILPQFMIFGLFTIHLALCRGLKTHLLLDSSPQNFVENLIRINPAMAFGGPVHWETLINNSKLCSNSLSNMRAPVSGGEKLSKSKEEQITEELLKAGAQEGMWIGYGASELSGSVTLKRGSRDKNGTIGKLHVYDNVMIVNPETGEELPYDTIGECYFSSPSLMEGYYKQPEEEQQSIFVDENGIRWFKSGDLGKIDSEGNIELTGRKKRLFVCGVNNVYPFEIEELIYKIQDVTKCVVVNVPHSILREIPKIHVIISNDTKKNRKRIKQEIIQQISENISNEIIPEEIIFEETLPYTPNGKVDFKKVREKDLNELKIKKLRKK